MSERLPEKKFTCRKCAHSFTPSFGFDFYPDGEDPEVGLCERCMMSQAFSECEKLDPRPITNEHHLSGVCRIRQGAETCRYLCFSGQMCCAKGSKLQAFIDQRFAEGGMDAKGDHCSGPPNFTPTQRA